MSSLTMDAYQELAHDTSGNILIGHPIVYPTLGMVNEAGEFAGKVKKLFRDNDGAITADMRKALKDELGDVLWYLSEIATQMEWSLNDVAISNITKLQKRKAENKIHGNGDNR